MSVINQLQTRSSASAPLQLFGSTPKQFDVPSAGEAAGSAPGETEKANDGRRTALWAGTERAGSRGWKDIWPDAKGW